MFGYKSRNHGRQNQLFLIFRIVQCEFGFTVVFCHVSEHALFVHVLFLKFLIVNLDCFQRLSINMFGSLFLCREIIKSNHQQQQQHYQHQNLLNLDIYNNAQVDSASALPMPGATMAESLLPFYQSNVCDPNTADSGLTYNLPLQRKRSREFTSELASFPAQQKNKLSSESSFFDQVLYQFQNQQSEIDRVLAHHVISQLLFNSTFFFCKSNFSLC